MWSALAVRAENVRGVRGYEHHGFELEKIHWLVIAVLSMRGLQQTHDIQKVNSVNGRFPIKHISRGSFIMNRISTKNTIGVITAAFAFGLVMANSSRIVMAQETFNLQDLIDTMGSFEVEDKRFSNFQYSWTGDMPPANNVNLVTLIDSGGNPGFRMTCYFSDTALTTGGTTGGSDALLTYEVDVTNPSSRIVGAFLAGNPNLLGGTQGSINVSETFLPLGASGEFTGEIFDDTLAGTQLIDSVDFGSGYTHLSVQKDIGAIVFEGSGTMSFVDQTFSQTTIPEPSTTLLLLLGLAMCGVSRRTLASSDYASQVALIFG